MHLIPIYFIINNWFEFLLLRRFHHKSYILKILLVLQSAISTLFRLCVGNSVVETYFNPKIKILRIVKCIFICHNKSIFISGKKCIFISWWVDSICVKTLLLILFIFLTPVIIDIGLLISTQFRYASRHRSRLCFRL